MAPCESANFLRDWFQTRNALAIMTQINPLLAQFLRHKFKSPPIKTEGTTCALTSHGDIRACLTARLVRRGACVEVRREPQRTQGRPADDEPALVIRPCT